MTTLDLYFFLTGYTLTVAAAAVVEYLRRREPRFLITVAVALACIPASAVVGAYIDPDKSIVDIFRFLVRVRDVSVIVALLMGVAAGLVWCTR